MRAAAASTKRRGGACSSLVEPSAALRDIPHVPSAKDKKQQERSISVTESSEVDELLVATESLDEAIQRIQTVIAENDPDAAHEYYRSLTPGDIPRLLSRIDDQLQHDFLNVLPRADAADVVESLPELQAAQLLAQMPPDQAAQIFDQIQSDEQADLLEQLPEEQSQAILDELPEESAASIRFLANYDRECAGGLMNTEYLAYRDALTVDDVLGDLRRFSHDYAMYNVQYIYVVSTASRESGEADEHQGDSEGKLVGVLPLRDLVLAPRGSHVSKLMIRNPISVRDDVDLSGLRHLFDTRPLFGLPVVDQEGHLLGVVRRSDVEQAGAEQASRAFLQFAGIMGGEELRSQPLSKRCASRLSWLSINILLNILAASVISLYEETLSAVIALAVFLPMVSDMSGCSGNQAVAVSTRELVLGVIRPTDWWHVFRKEFFLGLVNGVMLGVLIAIVAFTWKGSPALGLVVGAALATNTLVAVCLGSLIPLALKGLQFDPALASGPILTTCTDMCGFFLVLSFAQIMMPWLV